MGAWNLYSRNVAARALATYLVPGCIGRGVRLGSESSSVVVGGVWKSGNLEIWDFGNLEIWGPENPEILRFGDLEIQNFGIQKKKRVSKIKSVLPKMSARSGLVGKNPPSPIWGHPGQFFPWTEKIQKMQKNNICLPMFPVWGHCYYPPGVGE